jgi:WD40 repeat protein
VQPARNRELLVIQQDLALGGRVWPSKLWALAWSPDGSRLATGESEGPVQVWDAATGQVLRQWDNNHLFNAVAWSPDGRHGRPAASCFIAFSSPDQAAAKLGLPRRDGFW